MDVRTITYIESESEFSRARKKGFWEMVRSFFTRHDASLLSFNEVVDKLPLGPAIDRGVQDVPVKLIVGSAGRAKDFTRHFLPKAADQGSKERWRNIYTLAVTGKGFPPIEVYKMGNVYFVEDGHHRVSVANYLRWPTIQAHVIELPLQQMPESERAAQLDGKEDMYLSN